MLLRQGRAKSSEGFDADWASEMGIREFPIVEIFCSPDRVFRAPKVSPQILATLPCHTSKCLARHKRHPIFGALKAVPCRGDLQGVICSLKTEAYGCGAYEPWGFRAASRIAYVERILEVRFTSGSASEAFCNF